MKILFLSTENPFPVDHGHHLRTYQNLKALSSAHDVHFIGFYNEPMNPADVESVKKMCKTVDFYQIKYSGKSLAFLWMTLKSQFSAMPVSIRKYIDSRVESRIRELISGDGIDLVHFDLLHMSGYLTTTGDIPSVLINHNVEWMRIQRLTEIAKNPLLKMMLKRETERLRTYENATCEQVDCCIAVSDADQQMLERDAPRGNYEMIPNGVDAAFFKPNKHVPDVKRMVWAGGMDGLYNRDAVDFFLADIWPLIAKEIADATAAFIGKEPSELLRQVAAKDSRITAVGYVDDVRPHVDDALFFIAPLRAGSGTKLKVLNAMAQGRAVLTTSIGAEGIAATPDSEILVADTPQSFAQKAIWLLQHPEKALEIGNRARTVIEREYDWDSLEAKTLAIYERVAKRKE